MKRILMLLPAAALMLTLCVCAAGRAKPAAVPELAAAPESQQASAFEPDFTFTTTDRDDVPCDESVFAEHRLTMINFWEPWCGPCVGEMPDLEKLWQNYREQGFQILGVYQTPGMEEAVDAVLEETGVTYPILHYTDAFGVFQSGFVPTSIFVDGEGHILRHETDEALLNELRRYGVEGAEELAQTAFVGSNSYAGWEALVRESLK